MMLYVCEKPSQARDIAKVLGANRGGDGYLEGNGAIVTWCFGHLLEQAEPDAYDPKYKKWSFETLPILPSQWQMEVKKSGAKQFKVIKTLLSKAQHVVIATDADREGEMIAREVMEACRFRGQVSRLWLSALDDASIRKALGQLKPGAETEKLYLAGLARSRADWLVGMNLSRAFSLAAEGLGYKGALSVGRVQTPTLRLVVDRDAQIRHFVPLNYWDVIANCVPSGGSSSFKANWLPVKGSGGVDEDGRCVDQSVARKVADVSRGQDGVVLRCDTERKRQAAPLVYDLSTLQVEASKRWGFGAQQVLDIAQALYEKYKLTTYPRTDCVYLPVSQYADASAVLKALVLTDRGIVELVAQADTGIKGKVWDDSKITAHHGIIPTTSGGDINVLPDPERKIYDLVRRRYLAQFFPAHEYDQTVIDLECLTQPFRASGRVDRVSGWKVVYQQESEDSDADDKNLEAQALPKLASGDRLLMQDTELLKRQTKPPAPYTEGTLIQDMKGIAKLVDDPRLKARLKENAGIGTEATRASIIETLLQRGLIERVGKKKQLQGTPKGISLIGLLPNAVKDPAMTALWEQALESIASGDMALGQFMDAQIGWLVKMVDHARGNIVAKTDKPESVAASKKAGADDGKASDD